MKCELCNKEVNGLKGLGIHLKKKHKISNLSNYYDEYISFREPPKCYFCDDNARFLNLSNGYHRICGCNECLGKTRATGTFEFLMYKYDLMEEDAKTLQQIRANERGKKIKESFQILHEKDDNFHKNRCQTTKEYWINKGLSLKEAITMSKKTTDNFWKKSLLTKEEKKKQNPEIYSDVTETQLKYWLKKGYNLEDARQKLKERQTTNTLENYIKKYGEKNGEKLFRKRNDEWSTNIEQKYQNGDFSKIISETLFKK